jgi:hypothetical protein
LFNLLQNSYTISDTASDLQTAENDGDWVEFYTNMAQLIDLILDFESSKAAAAPSQITDPEEAVLFFKEEGPYSPLKAPKSRLKFEKNINKSKD